MLYDILEIVAFLFVILIEVQLYLSVRKLAENAKISLRSPIKIAKERKEKKERDIEQEKERKRFETLISNIEIYDGTSYGQRKIDE